MRKPFTAYALAAFVGMAVLVPGAAVPGAAAQEQHEHQVQAGQEKHADQMKTGPMKMRHPDMDEMAAKKKANSERIASLMSQIAMTSGEEKVAAMADLIAVLVGERALMQAHCGAMHGTLQK